MNLAAEARDALNKMVVDEILDRHAQRRKQWKDSFGQSEAADLARARYALETFIMAGYGDCEGGDSGFNELTRMRRSLAPVFGDNSLSQAGGGESPNLGRLELLNVTLKTFQETWTIMPGLPAVEEIRINDGCSYGHGNLKEARKVLQRLPSLENAQ